MTHFSKKITLKNLFINNKKQIGIQFNSDRVIELLIKNLNNPKWDDKSQMVYIANNKENLTQIFNDFKGIAWVNCKYFFTNKPINLQNSTSNLDHFRYRQLKPNYKRCPQSYIDKLELRKYAFNTGKTYISLFEKFINYYKEKELIEIDEQDITRYLLHLGKSNKSDSYLRQMVNSIKFYFEVVNDMPNRFYALDRPKKQKKLPVVISKKEALLMISLINNLKHKCVVSLLYSAGLRREEILNLKLEDIDSNRMVINVISGKGKKDRQTLLSKNVLEDLREYFKKYKPKEYLFEGKNGGKYSATSVLLVVKNAAKVANISKKVTPHTLRHCFATHLLEAGVNLRYIQALMGHESTSTTEIYTFVATNNIRDIKNLLD